MNEPILRNMLYPTGIAGPIGGMNSVSWGLATLAGAVVLGLALGAVRVRGVRLGVSGVLFSSLLFGQIGLTVEPKVLEFLRDFALILFVYAIGLQVGPGFLASLRSEGLKLNVLSMAAVLAGAAMTAALVAATRLPREAGAGIYSGAFTTTPGLAAGQEALRHLPAGTDSTLRTINLAYTVTYPFGIVGPILVIVALRRMFGVNLAHEAAALTAAEQARRPHFDVVDFELTRPEHAGIALRDHPLLQETGIRFSRLLRDSTVVVPNGDCVTQLGDVYRALGTREALDRLVADMGRPAVAKIDDAAGDVKRMDLVVTRTQVLRRSLRDLDLLRRMGVAVARVDRAGIELRPSAGLRLQFADRVTVVGPEPGLKAAETELGNCPETLNRPQLVPIFLGIVLGVLAGSVPLAIPGLHTELRIGLAGGPMLAAIALSQLGNIGSVVWYMPSAANQLFRDFGLAVFLACVGLQSGQHFIEQLAGGPGLAFVIWGAAVTVLPVLVIGFLARRIWKMNFVTLSGWVAGAMTSLPALSFANDLNGSEQPAVAYAAVAPLAMLAPIICAQLLVLLLV